MDLKELIISVLTAVFGEYWYVFIAYMLFNLTDWITGSIKAIKSKEVSSYIGIKGLIKKLGNWIIIGIAFGFSSIFVIIGNDILDINLSIMYSLGWFTFILLVINEVISILENLASLNIKVPPILMKSLKATDNILDNVCDKILENDNKDSDHKA